jgi:hypothetical protein
MKLYFDKRRGTTCLRHLHDFYKYKLSQYLKANSSYKLRVVH